MVRGIGFPAFLLVGDAIDQMSLRDMNARVAVKEARKIAFLRSVREGTQFLFVRQRRIPACPRMQGFAIERSCSCCPKLCYWEEDTCTQILPETRETWTEDGKKPRNVAATTYLGQIAHATKSELIAMWARIAVAGYRLHQQQLIAESLYAIECAEIKIPLHSYFGILVSYRIEASGALVSPLNQQRELAAALDACAPLAPGSRVDRPLVPPFNARTFRYLPHL